MVDTPVRVLVIDPDRDFARALATQLRPHGVTTGAMADSNRATAAVLRFSPDVVLVSTELTERHGTEVVAALTRDVRVLHLPAVIVTRTADGGELLAALRAGASDYLVRPLREDVAIPALLELARSHHAPGAPASGSASERMLRVMGRLGWSAELLGASAPTSSARFEQGRLVHARHEALNDEAALASLLALDDLRFESKPPSASAPASGGPEEEEDVLELDVEVEVDLAEAPPPSTPRCLLIDDEPDLLRLFSAFLTRVGLAVETAPDGAQGFEACLQRRPDVVVADLNMPLLDGWGLLRKIRDEPRLAETPVVFLSAQDDYREGLRAMGAGAQDYLAKADKMEPLARRVRAALEPRDRARTAVASGHDVQGRIEQLGTRWLLGELAAAKRSGTATFVDGLGTYQVGLTHGVATFAARSGQNQLTGEAALEGVIRLREGTVRFLPDGPPGRNLAPRPLPELLEQLAEAVSQADEAAMEALMVRAAGVETAPDGFSLYERVCPPFGREVARFIRAGKTPKQILAESDLDPVQVTETLRDIVRRRVIHLRG